MDHKFSVACGYENHIPLEIISSKANLELLSPQENSRKGKKCSISTEELVETYQPHPFVTKVAAMLRRMPLWKLKKSSVHVRRRLREFREARQLGIDTEVGNGCRSLDKSVSASPSPWLTFGGNHPRRHRSSAATSAGTISWARYGNLSIELLFISARSSRMYCVPISEGSGQCVCQ